VVYVRVTGRAVINVHTANAEGAVGNYMGLAKMFLIRRTSDGYSVTEDVVISGNMLKHWHAVRFVEKLKENGYDKLCDYCKRFVMYRSTMNYNDEFDFVKACAVEDLHGFLQPQNQVRRESLVKFSFALPVEELKAEYAAVTHNRVVTTPEGRIPKEEQAMMVFKREYASGLYGFLCTMDLAYVGKPLSDPENPEKKLPSNERKTRAKYSVIALADVLTGRFGASSSRAIPIIKTTELVCAVSKQPLPNLIHGFYMDYLEESAKLLITIVKAGYVKDLKVFIVGEKPAKIFTEALPNDTVVKCGTVVEALIKASEVAEQWLT